MPRLISLLKSRLFYATLGLGALSILIWYGADFIRFGSDNRVLGSTGRIVIILILVLLWAGYHLGRYLLERRRNRQLLQEMQHDDGAAPGEDQRSHEEQQALQRRFAEAMQLLRKSRFRGRDGSKSLYQLPWYIIIGPPGAGKTTALVNSGLHFPLAESHGKSALGGVGGTRNCDWWFTNEAVLIDTAGRYTTQDSHRVIDSGAWQNFLQLLKKYRRRRPVNGVILAISLQELLMQTAEQRGQQARTIRARLDELQEQLGIRFPVYVMFTKCDLVAGFSEFFAHLSAAEREQVWGVTYPLDAPADQLAARFGADCDALLQRLSARTLARMHQERDPGQRALIAGFPLQMGNLKSIAGDFLQQAFAANRFKEQPLLRGVYFSSGTQEGTPIDRMMAAVAANFRLGREVGQPRRDAGKSFFITRLLRDVIFAEADLVGANRQVENLLRWGRRAGFAGLGVLALITLATWTGAVARNNQHMQQVQAEVDAYRGARAQLGDWQRDLADTLPSLDPLRRASEVYQQENHPWLSGLGLYDPRVDRATAELYRHALAQSFLPRLQHLLESRLNQLQANDAELLPTLRVYLMLAQPEQRDDRVIRDWAVAHWQQTLPGQAGRQQALAAHLDALLGSGFQPPPADPTVVARARAQLRQVPVPQRVYARLKSGDNMRRMDLYSAIGGNTQLVFGIGADDPRLSAPLLFTREGYQRLDLSSHSPLLRQTTQERWLLGEDPDEDFSDADLARIADQVRQLYMAEYISFWQQFLRQLQLPAFDSLEHAAQVTRQLADPVYSPLLGTLRVVADNTRLTRAGGAIEQAAAGAGIERPQPTPVDREFRELQRLLEESEQQPAAIAEVMSALRNLHASLNEIGSAPSPAQAAFDSARGRFAGAGADPLRTLNTLAATQPQALREWLQQASRHSWGTLLGAAKQHVDQRWQQQVYAACQRGLADRFPLVDAAEAEAGIQDFIDFFKPGGIEAGFVGDLLGGFIDPQNWRGRQLDGQGLAIGQQSLAMLRRGQQIRSAFFGQGGDLAVQFSLRPERLDSAVRRFELDLGPRQTPLSYTHGPKIERALSWVGGEDRRARVLFEDLNDSVHRAQYEGDWALFRLLSASELATTERGNVYRLHIRAGGRSAQYELSTRSTVNPFAPGLLNGYRCLQRL